MPVMYRLGPVSNEAEISDSQSPFKNNNKKNQGSPLDSGSVRILWLKEKKKMPSMKQHPA